MSFEPTRECVSKSPELVWGLTALKRNPTLEHDQFERHLKEHLRVKGITGEQRKRQFRSIMNNWQTLVDEGFIGTMVKRKRTR